MPPEVFEKTVRLAPAGVIIGGGEPTLHPQILEFIDYAAKHSPRPFMVTNGAMRVSLWRELLKRFDAGKLDLHVSKDPWHDVDKIPAPVWRAAEERGLWRGSPADRPTRLLAMRGRAARTWRQLTQEALAAGYQGVHVSPTLAINCLRPRVAPDGHVYVDTGRQGLATGSLSRATLGFAQDIIDGIGAS
jgi:organic radical activating enzyme